MALDSAFTHFFLEGIGGYSALTCEMAFGKFRFLQLFTEPPIVIVGRG